MNSSAVCTGKLSVFGTDEFRRYVLGIHRMCDTGLIRAAQVVKIIDPRRRCGTIFLCDSSVLDDIQSASGRNGCQSLQVSLRQIVCIRAEQKSFELSVRTAADPVPAASVIQMHYAADQFHMFTDLLRRLSLADMIDYQAVFDRFDSFGILRVFLLLPFFYLMNILVFFLCFFFIARDEIIAYDTGDQRNQNDTAVITVDRLTLPSVLMASGRFCLS